jgi:hypothetical protein
MRETIFSPCQAYRYTLWRQWDMFNHSYLLCIGLNPSTADAQQDDPTIRRCIDFAKRWGYGALCMVNLFAYRSSDPRALYAVAFPVGPDNDTYIELLSRDADCILAAWGHHGSYRQRGTQVATYLSERPLMCFGLNKDGTPKHPLYVAKIVEPVPYLSDRKDGVCQNH